MERAELIAWLRQFGCAEEHGRFVFLRDPHWAPVERAAAEKMMRDAEVMPAPRNGWLCLRTGGSGGGFKLARHDEHTLSAAVAGFTRHFGLARVNAVGVLPPWHVSGLMARFRCAATGGVYLDAQWKALEAREFPSLPGGGDWVISLVPTQLQRLLVSNATVAWLRQFRVILLGGGPVWGELADLAANARLPISLSYGMTETAAMVAAQQPSEFLAGDRSVGRPMPHAEIATDANGRVTIAGASLFCGYFPETRPAGAFVTQDNGHFDPAGRLHIAGRADSAIITGGKKVHPQQVEAGLRASGQFEDVVVLGVPDSEWGERVVACYPVTQRAPDPVRAGAALADYERPKQYVPIATWPRNAQGKIDRSALLAAVVLGG